MERLDIEDRIDERVRQGLRGQWYAVAKSVQVRSGQPFGVMALGEKLVLWRDEQGALRCVNNSCPHRGAPLSRGEIMEGRIACRYHGIVVDGDGTIVRVPAMPDCPLEGRRVVKSYPAREMHDGVFVYFPSADRPEVPPLVLPEEVTSPSWASFLCSSPWRTNYQFIWDNLSDPMHGCYLHADTFTLAFGAKQDLMRIDKEDVGFTVRRIAQMGENFDWAHLVPENSLPFFRVEIPYPKAGGPGGPLRIVGCVTPVDENESKVFFWRCRQLSELDRECWRFLFRSFIEERHWEVIEQDRQMLESIPSDARKREMLYQHDLGVVRFRRVLRARAREQIEFEDVAAQRMVG